MFTPSQVSANRFLGFPPGKHFVIVPQRPLRAALAGLSLYDASYLHQRFAMAAASCLLRGGLGRTMRLRHAPKLPDDRWWHAWLSDVVEPTFGTVASAAFRILGDLDTSPSRLTMVFFDDRGGSVGFAKLWRAVANGVPDPAYLGCWNRMITTLRRFDDDPPATFVIPPLSTFGTYDRYYYLLQRPLPASMRQARRVRPATIRSIVDEIQERLADLPRPANIPKDYVPVHGDLTPVNLRVATDGTISVLDWDSVGWGARLGDEYRYWIADLARRPGTIRCRADRIIGLLESRGDRRQIVEASEWCDRVCSPVTERAERELRGSLRAQLV